METFCRNSLSVGRIYEMVAGYWFGQTVAAEHRSEDHGRTLEQNTNVIKCQSATLKVKTYTGHRGIQT